MGASGPFALSFDNHDEVNMDKRQEKNAETIIGKLSTAKISLQRLHGKNGGV